MSARVGVVVFPGSCDEATRCWRSTAPTASRPQYLWHGERDLQGVDAIVIPGGFSYGDYLRAGRDRALLAGDGGGRRASPREGGPVLGICNGFQVLCEAGLLPGALLPNESLRVRLPPGATWRSRATGTPFTPRLRAGRASSRCRSSTRPAASSRPPELLEQLEANGQVVLRYARRHEPERLAARHRRRRQRAGQRASA